MADLLWTMCDVHQAADVVNADCAKPFYNLSIPIIRLQYKIQYIVLV